MILVLDLKKQNSSVCLTNNCALHRCSTSTTALMYCDFKMCHHVSFTSELNKHSETMLDSLQDKEVVEEDISS